MTVARKPSDIVQDLGLSITSEFVPFSKSRNAKSWRSLNWVVTLYRNGKPVLVSNYSAGVAHCPGYSRYRANSPDQKLAIDFEIENGFAADVFPSGYAMKLAGYPVLPDLVNIVSSILTDSEVIEYSSFEEWANSVGYDADSRKAESIYRECLRIGLGLRSAFGDSELLRLRESFQDY